MRLSDEQVEAALAGLPEWAAVGGEIQRTFRFSGFTVAMAFVNRVAEAAEAMNHHPDMLIRYNKVTLTLSTHDAGGLTTKDIELAGRIDGLAATA